MLAHTDTVMCDAELVGPIIRVQSLIFSDMEFSWRDQALIDSDEDTTRLLVPQDVPDH